jgi:methyl-accepting chemotaxis protein
MTGMDTFFVVMAILDVIFIAGMALAGIRMLEKTREGIAKLDPALREIRALSETGQALAIHVKKDGFVMTQRVKTLVEVVKRRVHTTRQIIDELKPRSAETAATVRETAAAVRETSAELANKARTVNDLAQRLGRVRTAAEAAVRAGRDK